MKRSWIQSWGATVAYGSVFLCGLSLLSANTASAHINMLSPLLKDNNSGNEKAVPCDGPRGTEVFTFEPGAFITLGVSEEVPHDSYFRIAFDDDGEDFAEPASIDPINPNRVSEGGSGTASADNPKCLADPKDKCGESDFCKAPNKGAVVLYDNIDPHLNKDNLGKYSWTIQLPNVECENCTLQVLQVMEDIAFGFHGPFDGSADIYHRCLPIKLKKGAGTTGPGNATGPAKVGATSQACEAGPGTGTAGAGGSVAAGSGGTSSGGSGGTTSAAAGTGGSATTAAGSGGSAVVAPAAGSGGATSSAGPSGSAGKPAGTAGTTSTGSTTSPSLSAGAPSVTAGSGAPTTPTPPPADSGCSVHGAPSPQPVGGAAFAFGMVALALARRRALAVARRSHAS
jgi:hypothetical protein